MSLRLIYGKIGSGKTTLCIREALESGRRVYFITPEQFTFTAEKRICDLVSVHGLGGVEVLSLKRFAHRMLSVSEGAALPQLDARGKVILLQKILFDNAKHLSSLKKFSSEIGSAGALSKLLGEMKRHRISPQQLLSMTDKIPNMADKLEDLAYLYKTYNRVLHDKFYDSDDVMLRFSKLLENTDELYDTEIYFDRFDGFDASEFSVLRALMQKAKRVTVTLCYHPKDKNMTAFTLHGRLSDRLLSIAKESGVMVEPAIVLETERRAEKSLRFLENGYFSYPTAVFPDEPEGIGLVTASNPLGEVHAVARRILELCRTKGYLYRDIAIAARNTASYERYIEAVLPIYGIPFFMDRTIRILEHPFTVFVLSALELITKGYTYDSVFRYVKSGFLRVPNDEIDALENYVLATGVRGNIWKDAEKWTAKASSYALGESDEDKVLRENADEVRRKIMQPLLHLEEALKEGKTAHEKCEAIYSFLEEMKAERRISALGRLFEKNGDFSLASEYRGVYNDFIDALDGVCDAFGDEEISTRRLYDVLRVALGEVETGLIPAAQDGIMVGEIDRIKGYEVKALFVIGTVDGVFPASPETGGILSDRERKMLYENGLDFAFSENKTIFEEEHLIYKCLTIPRDFLFVSYPASDMDGGVLRPSRIYLRIKELFPKVYENNMTLGLGADEKISVPQVTMQYVLNAIQKGNPDDKMRMAYGWLLENRPAEMKTALLSLSYKNQSNKLSKETIGAFMGDTLQSSVSKLEKLSACPFSYFASYVLGAKERQVMHAGAADAGRFLHDFMDLFSRRLRENRMRWQEIDDAYIEAEFSEICPILDRRLSPYMLENSMRYARLFTRLEKAVKTAVTMLSQHMKKCAFEPLGYELSFSDNGDLSPLTFTLPGGGKVKLTGRIDRADILKRPEGEGTFLRIVDYKSGKKSFDLWDVYAGLDLQLCVYLSALCGEDNKKIVGENAKPCGMLYFKLSDPIIPASPLEEDSVIHSLREKQFKLSGLVLEDEEILRAMDNGVDSSASVLPAKITKSGITGSVATGKQFEQLEKHVKKTISALLTKLSKGDISISPYKIEDRSACTYCKFKTFCAHDGDAFRHLSALSKDEIWERMEAESWE